jgi:diguanylate cyclase (GGDEF)-like protein
MTFTAEAHTPAVAELEILRQVFSHDSIEQGIEQLAHDLSIFFQSHITVSTGRDKQSFKEIPAGAQTEWLSIDGASYGFVFVRDLPLSPAQRQHARLIIDLAGYWFSAVSEVHRLQGTLERSTCVDPLTRLANSRYFSEVLKDTIARAAQESTLVALMHIDLIGFKRINEELGDEIGDELLFSLAERMKRLIRSEDLVGRLGPDEFTVMLYNVGSPENVSRIVERFQNMLMEPPIPTKLWRGARVGIAMYPLDADHHLLLSKRAHLAVLSTKDSNEAVHAYYSELPMELR